MEIKLLSYNEKSLDLIYLACRQCYFDGWVGDIDISSIDKEEKNKLIKHVISSGHTSTLEHVCFSFAIKGISRACSHQLVRHRIGFSYSQQSQRYVGNNKGELGENERISTYVIPTKIKKNPEAIEIFNRFLEETERTYDKLKNLGISNEDSRFVLPNATKTNIVVTANCRSLLHFFEERCCSCAQWEIRELANKMLDICKDKLPEVFNDCGPKCYNLGYCNESSKRTCGKKPLKKDFLKEKI